MGGHGDVAETDALSRPVGSTWQRHLGSRLGG
jgi:hypothetical protein